jgi:hypothetical protein
MPDEDEKLRVLHRMNRRLLSGSALDHGGLGGIMASASHFKATDGGLPLLPESDHDLVHELVKDRIANVFKDSELNQIKESERADMLPGDRRILDIANGIFDRYLQLAKEWQSPFAMPTTANNFELMAMNAGRVMAGASDLFKEKYPDITADEKIEALVVVQNVNPITKRIGKVIRDFLPLFGDATPEAMDFMADWVSSAFARLEVGHRLAASLALTDVPPDFEVRAPWQCWSLVVPEGLFPPIRGGSTEHAARFWCVGSEPLFVITNEGRPISVLAHPERSHGHIYEAMRALIRSACLVISAHPDDFRKEKHHKPTARSGKKRHGPPELAQARFMLSAPVEVDCREMLHEALTGKTRSGSSPKVQFLVRGHPKRQAYGPKNSLRKDIWVQPFWKGPEDTRVLLRPHRVIR